MATTANAAGKTAVGGGGERSDGRRGVSGLRHNRLHGVAGPSGGAGLATQPLVVAYAEKKAIVDARSAARAAVTEVTADRSRTRLQLSAAWN
jgi:hypothetical protein